ARHPQAADRLVHGPDDGRRSVEGVEGGAPGAVVFLGREKRLQPLAELLPGVVLVVPGDGVGEDGEGDGAESPEAGECPSLLRPRGLRLAGGWGQEKEVERRRLVPRQPYAGGLRPRTDPIAPSGGIGPLLSGGGGERKESSNSLRAISRASLATWLGSLPGLA